MLQPEISQDLGEAMAVLFRVFLQFLAHIVVAPAPYISRILNATVYSRAYRLQTTVQFFSQLLIFRFHCQNADKHVRRTSVLNPLPHFLSPLVFDYKAAILMDFKTISTLDSKHK